MTDQTSARFKDKVLLATGAGSGIAAAAARRFSADGGRVAILDRDRERAEAVAAELDGSIAVEVDVADEASVVSAVRAVHSRCGRIDMVLNAAGYVDYGPFEEWTLERWNKLLGVHVGGTFLVCREVTPILRAQGGGAIVNTASVSALVAQEQDAGYTAAKGAILAFSRQIARDLAPDLIRVNVVAPGRTRTGMTEPLYKAFGDGDYDKGAALQSEYNLQRRVAEPAEIAGPICFLLSDDASYITGSMVVVDGGETAK